ncbi:MAG: SPOR domain-containing protein [Candidatus Cloacimonetes bacterium]|nr:SPOR domain-containing protein [Candidatus Cloacimonadota bacterium]
MLKKILLIFIVVLFVVSCNNNDSSPPIQATNMQDVSNQMNFQRDSSRWDEFIIDTENPPPGEWQSYEPIVEQPVTPPPVVTQPPVDTTPQVTTPTPPTANITQNPPTNNTTQTTNTTSPRVVPNSPLRDPEPGEFTVQLISSRERARVVEIRNTINAAGYQTEIQEAEVNGAVWYRLRLTGSFSRDYAEYIGQRIQGEFRAINDYWVTRR